MHKASRGLRVLAPVLSVTLLIGNTAAERPAGNSTAGFPLMTSSRDVITPPGNPRASSPLTENQPSQVRCVALGGYPPPRLEVRVDPRRDVTAQMVLRHGVNMATTSGWPGLRVPNSFITSQPSLLWVRRSDGVSKVRSQWG